MVEGKRDYCLCERANCRYPQPCPALFRDAFSHARSEEWGNFGPEAATALQRAIGELGISDTSSERISVPWCKPVPVPLALSRPRRFVSPSFRLGGLRDPRLLPRASSRDAGEMGRRHTAAGPFFGVQSWA
jgi:hypothetical protein